MTKIEALKKLLKENITSISEFKIDFKGDEFIVLDKDKNVIFRDFIKNYDTTFKSQKEFILKVARNVTSFIEVLEDIEDKKHYYEDLIRFNDKYYFDVVGSGDIYKTDTYIGINMDKLREDFKDNYKGCENFQCFYNDYINDRIDDYKEEIKNNFEDKGVIVVLYEDNNMFKVGFYVSAIRYEDEVYIGYIEDLDTSSNIDDLVTYDTITLYYSLMEDEKEADKAVEFIKELVA